jgi:hypothetical protein
VSELRVPLRQYLHSLLLCTLSPHITVVEALDLESESKYTLQPRRMAGTEAPLLTFTTSSKPLRPMAATMLYYMLIYISLVVRVIPWLGLLLSRLLFGADVRCAVRFSHAAAAYKFRQNVLCPAGPPNSIAMHPTLRRGRTVSCAALGLHSLTCRTSARSTSPLTRLHGYRHVVGSAGGYRCAGPFSCSKCLNHLSYCGLPGSHLRYHTTSRRTQPGTVLAIK